MKEIICFIDDSPFEHELIKNEIAPCAPDIEFVQAYTFDEARKILEGREPSLFLLDLWGQDPEVKDPYIVPESELKDIVSKLPSIDQLYEGAEDMNFNDYLRRIFTIVEAWRNIFQQVCSKIGQNRKYGLKNLMYVRNSYPGVPAVIYTRKSLIWDAIAVINAGADGIFIKPTGTNDEETKRLTREFAPRLTLELKRIIFRKRAILTIQKGCLAFEWVK